MCCACLFFFFHQVLLSQLFNIRFQFLCPLLFLFFYLEATWGLFLYGIGKNLFYSLEYISTLYFSTDYSIKKNQLSRDAIYAFSFSRPIESIYSIIELILFANSEEIKI